MIDVVRLVMRQRQIQLAEERNDVAQFHRFVNDLHQVFPLVAHPLREARMRRACDQRPATRQKPPQLCGEIRALGRRHVLQDVEKADHVEPTSWKIGADDGTRSKDCAWDHRARQLNRRFAVVDASYRAETGQEPAHYTRSASNVEDAEPAASTQRVAHQQLQLLVTRVYGAPIAKPYAEGELAVEALDRLSFRTTGLHRGRCYSVAPQQTALAISSPTIVREPKAVRLFR